MGRFDTIVLGGQVVLPGRGPLRADVGIKDGRISAVGEGFSSSDADEAIDATGKLVLPGAVDAHFHLGIYRDITEDTESETLSSLAGGVTSVISYFRTGSHYLEKSGPYADIIAYGQSKVDARVMDVSVVSGFSLGDSVKNGMSVIVTTRNDATLAETLARDIARKCWGDRKRYVPRLLELVRSHRGVLRRVRLLPKSPSMLAALEVLARRWGHHRPVLGTMQLAARSGDVEVRAAVGAPP